MKSASRSLTRGTLAALGLALAACAPAARHAADVPEASTANVAPAASAEGAGSPLSYPASDYYAPAETGARPGGTLRIS